MVYIITWIQREMERLEKNMSLKNVLIIVDNIDVFPVAEKVYEKYYEKQLVQQALEEILKKNELIFSTYCYIKESVQDEKISVEYIRSDEDTL